MEWEKKKSIPPQAEGQQSHYAARYSVINVSAVSKTHVIWLSSCNTQTSRSLWMTSKQFMDKVKRTHLATRENRIHDIPE